MFSTILLTATAVLVGSPLAAAGPYEVLYPAECYQGERAARLCYTAPNNTPQDVSVDDIKFAASYLRAYGHQ